VNVTTASYNICTGSYGLLYQFAALVGHTLPSTIGLITPLFGNILDISNHSYCWSNADKGLGILLSFA